MFIYNFKINKKAVIFFIIIISVITALFIKFSKPYSPKFTDITKENVDIIVKEDNFVSTIKSIHENIDKNIGKKIKITGFVFRMPDFKENIFLCGKDVEINGEEKIAGILCMLEDNKKFLEEETVEIYGEIIKGEYNEKKMPIIKVEKINKKKISK